MHIFRNLAAAFWAQIPMGNFSTAPRLEMSPVLSQSEQSAPKSSSPPAIVLWHGLGDNYDSKGMNHVASLIQELLPDVFVHSVYIDSDASLDERRSLFGDANTEVAVACEQLQNITQLSEGFGAIGFSQGGLFMRAVVERCGLNVSTLVTFGSPHMGVLELPVCQPKDDWVCRQRNALLKRQVWRDLVQKTIVPAQYFRDPAQYDEYLQHSHFLAALNNEVANNESEVAASRFALLEKLVLIQFSHDTTLVPKESAFFQELDPRTGEAVAFDQTEVYTKNLFGLKTLHEQGKVEFQTVEDEHMRFTDEFLANIIQSYFGGSPI